MKWVSLQRMLNLDDISEEEAISIEEDTDTDCILCQYTNHEFLDQMHSSLNCTTSKNNLYDILYNAFNKQMNTLKQQNMEYHTISRDQLINHYENHLISIERTAMEDIRLCKKMMKSLEKKIVTREGLDTTALTQWRSLSNHKINLLKNIKRTKRPLKLHKPHDFSS